MARRPRREKRVKRRTPCEIDVNGRPYRAIALDLSPSGMFVKTQISVAPGAEVTVRVCAPDCDEPIELSAVVARARRVPAQLATLTSGGVGLRLRRVPPAYRELLAQLAPEGTDLTPRAAPLPAGSGHEPAAGCDDRAPVPGCDDRAPAAGCDDRAPAAGSRAAAGEARPGRAGRAAPAVAARSVPRRASRSAVAAPRAAGSARDAGPRAPAAREGTQAATGQPSFRVRVKLRGRSRSRTLVVTGASPDAARAAALDQVGGDWDVLCVERA